MLNIRLSFLPFVSFASKRPEADPAREPSGKDCLLIYKEHQDLLTPALLKFRVV